LPPHSVHSTRKESVNIAHLQEVALDFRFPGRSTRTGRKNFGWLAPARSIERDAAAGHDHMWVSAEPQVCRTDRTPTRAPDVLWVGRDGAYGAAPLS
jgi:hypothetical protein